MTLRLLCGCAESADAAESAEGAAGAGGVAELDAGKEDAGAEDAGDVGAAPAASIDAAPAPGINGGMTPLAMPMAPPRFRLAACGVVVGVVLAAGLGAGTWICGS